MTTQHLDKFSRMELNANFNACMDALNNITNIEGHVQLGFVAFPIKGKREEAEKIISELATTAELLGRSLNIKLSSN